MAVRVSINIKLVAPGHNALAIMVEGRHTAGPPCFFLSSRYVCDGLVRASSSKVCEGVDAPSFWLQEVVGLASRSLPILVRLCEAQRRLLAGHVGDFLGHVGAVGL